MVIADEGPVEVRTTALDEPLLAGSCWGRAMDLARALGPTARPDESTLELGPQARPLASPLLAVAGPAQRGMLIAVPSGCASSTGHVEMATDSGGRLAW